MKKSDIPRTTRPANVPKSAWDKMGSFQRYNLSYGLLEYDPKTKRCKRSSLSSYQNESGRVIYSFDSDKPKSKLTKKVKKHYINYSARKISHKLNISKWKKIGVINFDGSELKTNLKAALIMPDGEPETPTFLIFNNYEKILKWNRSLRFGISVCTLAGMIKA